MSPRSDVVRQEWGPPLPNFALFFLVLLVFISYTVWETFFSLHGTEIRIQSDCNTVFLFQKNWGDIFSFSAATVGVVPDARRYFSSPRYIYSVLSFLTQSHNTNYIVGAWFTVYKFYVILHCEFHIKMFHHFLQSFTRF